MVSTGGASTGRLKGESGAEVCGWKGVEVTSVRSTRIGLGVEAGAQAVIHSVRTVKTDTVHQRDR